MPCPFPRIGSLGLETQTQYWMTLSIGDSPCYRGDRTRRLPDCLIMILFDDKDTPSYVLAALDIVESSLKVNGKKLCAPPTVGDPRIRYFPENPVDRRSPAASPFTSGSMRKPRLIPRRMHPA